MTSLSREASAVDAIAEDYMTKPVDPVELIAKIRNLLLLRKRASHALIH